MNAVSQKPLLRGLPARSAPRGKKTILGNSWEPLKTKKSAREPRYYDLMAMEGGKEKG